MSKNFDIEKGFISKLLQTKDMLTVKDEQIKVSFFTGDNRSAYQFILDTVINTGEVPSVRAFKQAFPRYTLETINSEVGTEENLKYWCNELRNKVKQNHLAEQTEEIAEALQSFDTEKAYTLMKKSVLYMESEVEKSSDVDITKDISSRKEAYLKKKQNKGMIGLPTGFDKLDYLTKGLKPDTLTTVIAKTGVGKTFFEVLIGSYLMLNNYSVMQVITEMSEELMRDRYEAVLFAMSYGIDFRYNDFKSGTFDLNTEKQFFEFLENDLPKFEPLILVSARSPMAISAALEKYKPDIVLVDGAYLLEDDSGAKDDWLRITHVTRDLKMLAKTTHLPFMMNTQADINTSKKSGPALNDIKYAQSIGQDSDDIFSLFRDEVMLQDKEMGLRILKQREGTLGKIVLNWDFETMDFSEIYSENDDDSDTDNSKVKDNTIDIKE